MFGLNRENADQRDMILFGEKYDPDKYLGGTRHFHGVAAEDYERLLTIDTIDPEDSQNGSPTAREIYEFMKAHDGFTAHGYAVCPDRYDYRVSLEGVECDSLAPEDIEDFVMMFRFADEFTIDGGQAYCWYD